MKPILEIRNISKRYKVGGQKQGYLSIRDQLVSSVKGIASIKRNKEKNTFWALKDISFDVYPGESIGIIGRNGAGKSTLLKVLSKITPPTDGYIKARGRVASLLEVGTGFHPELTGRENVFLNGSILGLTRAEINRQFDAIIDFSGIEKFLDTPLKHYSSGMQLRLAFAVAAHLEPEILVIDEVLAVGDATFQKKCLGKMNEVSNSGRTILFVSHNMAAMRDLCKRAVVLEKGEKKYQGPTTEAIQFYLDEFSSDEGFWTTDGSIERKYHEGYIKSVKLMDESGTLKSEFSRDEKIIICFEMMVGLNDPDFCLTVDFYKGDLMAFRIRDFDSDNHLGYSKGRYLIYIEIPNHLLNYGIYRLTPNISLFMRRTIFKFDICSLLFRITSEQDEGSTKYKIQRRKTQVGIISPKFNITIKSEEKL